MRPPHFCEDKIYKQELDLTDKAAVAKFEKMRPGMWGVLVMLTDKSGEVVERGHSGGILSAGQSLELKVVLQAVNAQSGTISVDIPAPLPKQRQDKRRPRNR